jgi:phosphoribosylformylglycinamidine (FGAM) synthase-like enzyme
MESKDRRAIRIECANHHAITTIMSDENTDDAKGFMAAQWTIAIMVECHNFTSYVTIYDPFQGAKVNHDD